jgi:hypothetical protein
VRSNGLKTYAASGLILAVLAAYGVVTLSSRTSVVTHAATSTAPSHLIPSAHPVASTPPDGSPVSPPPVVRQRPPVTSDIPEGAGGEGDPDNSGSPSDGDGNAVLEEAQ